MNLRRVLILADESADWMIAGLRQLDRLALSIDEFAVENGETEPVALCIWWRADLDQCQRWVPAHPRLTHVAFTSDLDDRCYDLILSTRLFLYRKAVAKLLETGVAPRPIEQSVAWETYVETTKPEEPSCAGAWEYVSSGEQIDNIERRFLRGSGKPQDGYVSRYLNRPISRTTTRLLLQLPVTPNVWTWLIFPIPVLAALVLGQGNYWAFVWGMVFFQLFSILDGCDGEIARAKFMESERGRRLDDLFDVISNILLVLGLGFGLSRTHPRFGWLFVSEGIVAAMLIAITEWFLTRAPVEGSSADSLGGVLYPRHHALVERSGLLVLGEKVASALVQLTKRDVAVLFFLLLAISGLPAMILHLLFAVTAVSLVLAWRARLL